MPKKVALVLSSGGARGLAHIGVIERLVEEGYQISSISGSSIGAVIGAFYACGKLDLYKKWVLELERLDLFKLFDFTFSVQGFIRGEKVFNELQKIIPDVNIEDMDIPFVAVATDAKAKQEVVFKKGSMYKALRASTAIPTVLKPLCIDGMELIDGGVSNPIPVDKVKRNDGDILIVSNVNANIPYEPQIAPIKVEAETNSYEKKLNDFLNKWGKLLPGSSTATKKLGFFDLLNRSIDMMQDKLTTVILDKYQPDILINVSSDACSTFEFYKAKEIIEAGREAFDKCWEKTNKAVLSSDLTYQKSLANERLSGDS